MAKRPTFLTVADVLLPSAHAAYDHFRGMGYRVTVEKADAAAPYAPTMTAVRTSTTVHVEVCGVVDFARMKEWVSYSKSTARDTRVSVCMPASAAVSAGTEEELRKLGVGLLRFGTTIAEAIAPIDLALNVELPALPPSLREALGPAYEKYQRGEWRECFEEACNALEEEARRYLKRWSKTGRIKVQRKKGPMQLTISQINGLSMGGVRNAFRDILSPTSLDSAIEQVLAAVNPDRVERVHRRRAKRTETRLRRNMGKHMWQIVNVMKQMIA
jgi:hypothetical protein